MFGRVRPSLDTGQHSYKVLKHVDRAIAVLVNECENMAPHLTSLCCNSRVSEGKGLWWRGCDGVVDVGLRWGYGEGNACYGSFVFFSGFTEGDGYTEGAYG